ncbi:ATP-NAD kinase family protein [Halobacterium salinarum]|uniref:NAD kinase-like protein n=1 Tax=Halobacterium salinarum (strain ATCC 33171 / DSM 3754 / JCM 8978 / NBRC 102687 / NCIMB 764 / 91-R6) TaxID=2597657 RepID=A0A4D6GRZ8_HALS9|nr:ATP-NAD kinase family protein [Halobacterium salinarum]MCF2207952.1 ATP-NAD kinase family protein [Halobacterium salinarum]MDL0124314.1 ATP-NAD kinase family protein [Halobacterium salinarum]MDL0130671.1 ATP-NAD kinase family protein [Halobacterium salinarum]MDL0135938.1 ATP-NAD kinase family protein [Halobacterium salinarum]MDL0144291.1 ATP-NAD kinase family protein [Halobacterium salinarum]
MRTVGVVVNPIAGMGGRVGLKGTDGNVAEARERGADQRAPQRARTALDALRDAAGDVSVVTYDEPMGGGVAAAAGFTPTVVGHPTTPASTAADTRAAVEAFIDHGVDVILFVGGDGTATDVATAVTAHDASVPVLGVPAGVKVYSAVFAVQPAAAGRVAATFEDTTTREVSDIDEGAYRDGEVQTTLRGVVATPVTEGADALQPAKQAYAGTTGALAAGVADSVRDGVTYVLGPGGTLAEIADALGVSGSPLGVDVYRDGALVVRDGSASEITAALGTDNVVYVSPIGGQGFVFGRGNDQISPAIIDRSEVRVVASPQKLDQTGVLRVDTGSEDTDASLRGWQRVRTGRFEKRLVNVV